jgi:hypothetical protein
MVKLTQVGLDPHGNIVRPADDFSRLTGSLQITGVYRIDAAVAQSRRDLASLTLAGRVEFNV